VLAWIGQVPASVEWWSSVCGGVALVWRPTGVSSWSPPFAQYTVEVLHIIASCGLIAHCYADDTQIYVSVPVSALTTASQRSFTINGSTVCNSLPAALRAPDRSLAGFKHHLKTYLFEH